MTRCLVGALQTPILAPTTESIHASRFDQGPLEGHVVRHVSQPTGPPIPLRPNVMHMELLSLLWRNCLHTYTYTHNTHDSHVSDV